MNNKQKLWVLCVPLIFLFLILSVYSFIPSNSDSNNVKDPTSDSLKYTGIVCKTLYDYSEKKTYDLGCGHNLITNDGKNLIRNVLASGSGAAAVVNIGLCNSSIGCTAPAATDTSLMNEYAAGGLSRAAGSWGPLQTGNWSVSKTFTATADNLYTNMTGLFNGTSGNTLFAENTFTTVGPLMTNDQLTINWTLSIA